ncbi:MAG: hypothetical protein A3F72_01835 [Bacteroidetes bacterium RIFCSPLOWO2_12_FULL_35_15]|nr:MAG: hypothetical protein A3F72_01835 [Bacteroidetes bacterium RIFCSPLOWO2_12_FULL_35_15]
MKNKKLLYILIPLTLLVWGIIVYRIIATTNSGNENQIQSMQQIENATIENMNDTFLINPNYRDPFLGKMIKNVTTSATTSLQKTITTVKNTPILSSWPTIVYLGIIKNQKSNKQLTLVQINGQSYSMKIGETVNSVELCKVFKDSIEVKFGKEKKFCRK